VPALNTLNIMQVTVKRGRTLWRHDFELNVCLTPQITSMFLETIITNYGELGTKLERDLLV